VGVGRGRSVLAERGFRAVPLTLPGLDPKDHPDRASRTLEDQVTALVGAMTVASEALGGPVVLVGHSGANARISLAVDRHPELVRRIIWVDSGPLADGAVFAPDTPEDLRELPLPDFDALAERASFQGLDEAALARFRERAVPAPGSILRDAVRLSNDARRAIPTTLVCTSIPSEQIFPMAAAGHPMVAEIAQLSDVVAIDLPTGHWPQWSRPRELAEIIAIAVGEEGGPS
jgi:pimeloyl-ACP methyl ester carboxylesterase